MPYKDKAKQLEYQRKWYQDKKNGANKRKSNYRSKKKLVRQSSEYIQLYKLGHPCKCGESDPCCLDFHHIDEKDKINNVSTMSNYGTKLSRVKEEIDKCIILCKNCHAKLHSKKVLP